MEDSDHIFQLEADFLKSLAHPTRLRIQDLLREGERCVCEVTEELELEQANVSQHLAVLKRQGLISSRKDGLRVIYRLDYPEVYTLVELIKRILKRQAENAVAALSG
ncbi:MAG: ArsR family transcriptional regulator [Clostridia bacterium]|nr:MAG: ArsR family transcriptional regulator [Clostridia bacterium]